MEKQYLIKEDWGQIGERNKTLILLRVSTIAKPRPIGAGASSQRRGSAGPHFCPFLWAMPNATK